METPVRPLPYIYGVTPTVSRLEQKADLTRLSQTLRLVRNLHWILVEDSRRKTHLVTNFLAGCSLSYTHLNATTPPANTIKGGIKRGVPQRNTGIKWLRENAKKDGVVYFADDDNTYDLRIFEEVRLGPVCYGYKWATCPGNSKYTKLS